MVTRISCVVLAGTMALAAGRLGQAQIVGPVKVVEGTGEYSAETPLFEVYQTIFASLGFFSRGVSGLPRDDAGWEKWPGDQVRQNAIAYFVSIGLDEKSASTLFPHVRDGLAQQQKHSLQQMAHLCERRADISSKAQIGDALANLNDELDRMKARLWGDFDYLDDINRQALVSHARVRREEVQIYRTDARLAIGKSSETLEQMLGRICLPR